VQEVEGEQIIFRTHRQLSSISSTCTERIGKYRAYRSNKTAN
jgi:hypothetical protein